MMASYMVSPEFLSLLDTLQKRIGCDQDQAIQVAALMYAQHQTHEQEVADLKAKVAVCVCGMSKH